MSKHKMDCQGIDEDGCLVFADPPRPAAAEQGSGQLTSGPTIGRVWLAECQRCANSEYSVESGPDAARAELAEMGWSRDYCPACNGVSR